MAFEQLSSYQISQQAEKFVTVAEASSFEELKEIMPRLQVPKGGRVRFVMELNFPVAPAFDLPGAEIIFRQIMPPGLTLLDVWGEGWRTAVIEFEVDPAWLPAVASFLARNWLHLSLAAIGIVTALGFLVLSIRVDVTKVLEALPWVAIGLVSLAVIGLTVVFAKQRIRA